MFRRKKMKKIILLIIILLIMFCLCLSVADFAPGSPISYIGTDRGN